MTDPWYWDLNNVHDLADWLVDTGLLAPVDHRLVELFPRTFDEDWDMYQQAKAAMA